MTFDRHSWQGGAIIADGLTDEESKMMERLCAEYDRYLFGNEEKLRFYNDEVSVDGYDTRVPKELRKVRVSIGACAKAVNMLARRSIFDGFTIGESKTSLMDDIVGANSFDTQYAMAVPSELTHGFGSWTVSPGDTRIGEPKAVVNYHDPLECAVVWDYRRRRVKYGMVIEDVERVKPHGPLEPVFIVLHTDHDVVEISRDANSENWTAVHKPHAMGQPMMVAMRYQPTKAQPLGKSRVSKTMRSLTIQMMLATYNMMAHDQYCSIPQKWILGLSEEQLDALMGREELASAKSMFLATVNDEGTIPTAGAWQSSGVTEHTQVLENIAQRMASESDLPLSAFGVLGSNYTSSDALNAASHDLVILAEALNRTNKEALTLVAKMALCVAQDKPWSDLTDEEQAVTVHFRDPSMLSASQVADAMLKICTTVPGFAGTDVYWERLGFDEDERRRVKAELAENQQLAIAASVFS